MPDVTPRVVFDCNLFVQGIANRNSPARKALRLFFNGDISRFVNEPIIREVRNVLLQNRNLYSLVVLNPRHLERESDYRLFKSIERSVPTSISHQSSRSESYVRD